MQVLFKHLLVLFFALCCSKAVKVAYASIHGSEISETFTGQDIGKPVKTRLRDPNYSLTSEDKHVVAQHMASIPELGIADGKLDIIGLGMTGIDEQERQELMKEDWNSLSNEVHKFFPFPLSQIWLAHESVNYESKGLYTSFEELENLLKTMKPYFTLEEMRESGLTSKFANLSQWQQFKFKSLKFDKRLFQMISDLRSVFQDKNFDIRFLDLQRIIFETIHYFYKYGITTQEGLVSLFRHYDTIEDLASYVFESYKVEQKGVIMPLAPSSKNVLNYGLYSKMKVILKALGAGYEEAFSKAYIDVGKKYYKIKPEHPRFRELGSGLERIPFLDQLFYNQDMMSLIVHIFTKPHPLHKAQTYTQLAYVFHTFEHLREYHPKKYQILEGRYKDFKEKFELTSSSSQLIADMEREEIYINKRYQYFEFQTPFSYTSENIELARKNLEELKMFAKHMRMIESECHIQARGVGSGNPLIRLYSQEAVVKNKLDYMKAKISGLSEHYEDFLSRSSTYSLSSWLDTSKILASLKAATHQDGESLPRSSSSLFSWFGPDVRADAMQAQLVASAKSNAGNLSGSSRNPVLQAMAESSRKKAD